MLGSNVQQAFSSIALEPKQYLYHCYISAITAIHQVVCLQGYHSGSFFVALLGIFKAVVGLLIRPAVGTLELLGKSAHGVGLLFLGREGISGTIQKRARAPGTLTDDSDEVSTCTCTMSCLLACCCFVSCQGQHCAEAACTIRLW